MKQLLFYSLLLFVSSTTTSFKSQEDKQPNIIILFADDLGYGDLGSYGHPTIRTPNLDKMGMNGVKFTNFYSGSPACTASRYALLTGKYPVHSGFSWVLYPESAKGIHEREQTLAEELKYFGYATGCFGKWHLGSIEQKFLPLQNGFDEYLGLPYSNDMIPPRWGKIALFDGNDTLELSPDQSTLTKRYTERTIQFIQKNKDQPFFAYVPYAMPHLPLHPGKDFAGTSARGTYGDVVEEIDWSVGKILKSLEKEGLSENTLVIFTSDNGPWIIKNEKGGSSGLLRDGKGSTWEGGMRVPAMAYWKGKTSVGKVVQTPASTLDLFETCRKLAYQSRSKSYIAPITDGKDISNLLFKKEDQLNERPFFYYGPGNRLQAVRKGDWKLHIITNSQTRKRYFPSDTLLFQLSHDPSEQYDLAKKFPNKTKELLQLLEKQQGIGLGDMNFYKKEREKSRINHIALNKEVTFNPALDQKYNNVKSVTDGYQETHSDFRKMAGVQDNHMLMTIDLGKVTKIESIEVGFLQSPKNWIFLPNSIEIFTSKKEKEELKLYKSWNASSWSSVKNPKIYQFKHQNKKRARYITVIGKDPKCPREITMYGQKCWIFADEIIVN